MPVQLKAKTWRAGRDSTCGSLEFSLLEIMPIYLPSSLETLTFETMQISELSDMIYFVACVRRGFLKDRIECCGRNLVVGGFTSKQTL